MSEAASEEVISWRDGDISFVHLNRPERNNTLTFSVLEALEKIALGFVDDIQTRVVIFSAEGEHFSFGADLNEVQAEKARGLPLVLRRRQMAQGANLLKAIQNIPQVTICALQGLAVGGGAAIASACDFRIGSSDCKVSYGEVKLNMCLMWQAMPLCVHLIGAARTKRMIMSGLPEDADVLLRWGFLDAISPPEELAEQAVAMARIYTALPPAAVQAMKQSVNAYCGALDRSIMHMDTDQFLLLQDSDDAREALAAMKEKRCGKFTGN